MQETPPVPTSLNETARPSSILLGAVRSPLFWLFVLLAVAYAPIFWGEIIFFRDPAHWNYPARAFVRRALLNGEFPHWNPFVGLGVPVWANPLYAILYPPNWPLLIVPERLVASALTWQSAAHTLWGGIGAYLLARQFRCRPVACLVAGLSWALSGYTTSMWSAGLLLIAGAWLPWVSVGMLAATRRLMAGQSWMRVLPSVTAPIAMALLTGEVFIAITAVGFGIATVMAWWVGGEQGPAIQLHAHSRRSPVRIVAFVTAGIFIAFLIGMIVIAPAGALIEGTGRAQGTTLAQSERFSFHPIRVLELFAPRALGVPLVDYPGARYAGEESIEGLPLAFSSYLGASVLGLALLGIKRRSSWVLVGLWLFFLFVCFGRFTPVHAAWRAVVVPFKYMRYPEKYFVLLVGWTSLLAALGFERLLAEQLFRGRRLLVFLATLAVVFLVIGFAVEPDLARYVRRGSAMATLIVGLLFALLWLRRRQEKLSPLLIAAVVALDLMSNVWEFQRFRSGAIGKNPSPLAAAIQSQRSDTALPPRLYRSLKVDEAVLTKLRVRSPADAESLSLLALTPNIGSVFGIATVPGYDAAKPKAIEDFWRQGLPYQATLLRLLSVEFALLPVADSQVPDARTEDYEPLMDPIPGARLYRVKETLPRAYLAGSSVVLDDQQTLSRLFTAEVAAGELVLVAAGQGDKAMQGGKHAGWCTVQSFDLNRVEIKCHAQSPGIAVLVEQYSAGWSATVDSIPAHLLRVNHVMRGVHVDAGVHRIEMTYRPPVGSWVVAVFLSASLLTAVLFFADCLRSLSKAKRAPEGPQELAV